MGRELWNQTELTELSNNFIPLRVDVDLQAALAQEYHINSIPSVVVVDASGEVLWERAGFQRSDTYIKILRHLPVDLEALTTSLLPIMNKSSRAKDYYAAAAAYHRPTS